MFYKFSPSSSLADFSTACQALMALDEVTSVLAFTADENRYDQVALTRSMSQCQKPIMGGVFPQIIYDSVAFEQGFVLMGLSDHLEVKVLPDLSDVKRDLLLDIEQAFDSRALPQTCITFVDGLSSCISNLIDGLFEVVGSRVNFVGGGAGSLCFQQRPCLFCNQGVYQNAALLGFVNRISHIGVGHGWQSLVEGLQVTRSAKNIIYEIDNQNALSVYNHHINQYQAVSLNEANFFSVAQAYPLGINRLNSEKIVRDPISITSEGALICVGEVRQGDFVDLLTASPTQLIESAAATAAIVLNACGSVEKIKQPMVFNCISRALFLKSYFSLELMNIAETLKTDNPIVGALVLGEIANSGKDCLEFYNKTTVVTSFDSQS